MLVLCDPEHAGASGPWAPAQCVGLGRLALEARRIQEAAPLKKALSGHPRAWTGPEPLRGHAVDHECGRGPGGVASPCLLGTPPGPLAATLLVMPHVQAHVGSLEVRCGHVALPGLWKSPRLLPRPREQGAPISCALCCSPKRSPSRASRPVLGRRGRRELLPYSFQTACPLGSGRDTPPPPACGTCGWARDLCWVQPRGRGGLRQGSTAQPGPTRTHAGISHDAGISLRCCVRCWGLWPVTEGMLALGPSPVRAGSPRTGRLPPLVLPVPTETGPCPRAWLTGRSAHTCVWLCAAPRAGWLRLVLRVPASLLRSLPLSPVSPRTRVTPGRPLRSCDTDAQRGNSAGPNLNPSPQVQALPDPGWDQRPSSPD